MLKNVLTSLSFALLAISFQANAQFGDFLDKIDSSIKDLENIGKKPNDAFGDPQNDNPIYGYSCREMIDWVEENKKSKKRKKRLSNHSNCDEAYALIETENPSALKGSDWKAFRPVLLSTLDTIEEREREREERALAEKERALAEQTEKFVNLFSNEGTVIQTEVTVSRDKFGDEIKTESTYFLVDDQTYYVSAICSKNPYPDSFPYRIRAEFPKRLNYTISKSHPYYGHIPIEFKLSSGKKDMEWLFRITEIVNESLTSVDMSKTNRFTLWGSDAPLALNFKERESSMTYGETHILIPKSSSDYYSLKFNPFHVSWLEYYQSKCETVSNVAKI